MTREGELVVRLPWDGERVRGPTLVSSRAFVAERLFAGKSPAQVVAMVPLLFNLCGGAQRAAASAALAAAGAPDIGPGAADEVGVVLETVQEYFWRLLIDWPQAMGRPALATPVAAARHRVAAGARDRDGAPAWRNPFAMRELGVALGALAEKSIYGVAPAAWLAIADPHALQRWIEDGATLPARLLGELIDEVPDLGRSDIALMPDTADALLATVVPAMLREPAFARAPTWDGVPMETGALSRMRSHPLIAAIDELHGHAVVTRMIARLTELAALLRGLEAGERGDLLIQAFALDTAHGLAAVQTARGLLLHRARLEDGKVAEYQIVAPTEWNFHPAGALIAGLSGLAAPDEVELSRRARLAVQALDPCVACRIETGHA
ncbi:MAG TPA: nickel-dependent hydrogenase large subunit [Casimicrobiaceae bacterium]|nr:nickel-dependent hydrogenase large subunit [Casimicrobiaceae bacterium]